MARIDLFAKIPLIGMSLVFLAMFLRLRGWINCDATHPLSPTRPQSDRAILLTLGQQLGLELEPD